MGTSLDLTIQKKDSFYFPVDLDVKSKCFFLQRVSIDELKSNTFLDNRFFESNSMLSRLDQGMLSSTPLELASKTGYLFHTSFCCSTLLARLLDFPRHSLALKEPLILRRLSDAELIGDHDDALHRTALNLLFRSVSKDCAILVKPTHVALNIAESMLSYTPITKALLITSTLEDFLVSNIKKSSESKQKVPELVERFMSATDLARRLPPQAFSPPTFLCGVALQWYAQQSVIQKLLNGSNGHNIKLLWEKDLLSSPREVLESCLQWLGWSIPAKDIETQINLVMQHHAKSIFRPYDPSEKKYEDTLLLSKYRDNLDLALRWSDQYLRLYLERQ